MSMSVRKSFRRRLILRDGNTCHYCNVEMTEVTSVQNPTMATLEHVVPASYGGPNDMKNLVLACAECNNARGNELNFCWCSDCTTTITRFFDRRFYSLINANKPRIKWNAHCGKWSVINGKKTIGRFNTWAEALNYVKEI